MVLLSRASYNNNQEKKVNAWKKLPTTAMASGEKSMHSSRGRHEERESTSSHAHIIALTFVSRSRDCPSFNGSQMDRRRSWYMATHPRGVAAHATLFSARVIASSWSVHRAALVGAFQKRIGTTTHLETSACPNSRLLVRTVATSK